jgi:hypothetical protein
VNQAFAEFEIRERLLFFGGEVMMRQGWKVALGVLAVIILATPAVRADKKQVKFVKEWKGSVEDEKLAKDAPNCITNAKDFAKLWKAWKIKGKAPKVNFQKELVIVTTGSGSKLNLSANLDDKGNLQVLGFGTRDLVPGFRYVIASVPRKGIKTVNGKDLSK